MANQFYSSKNGVNWGNIADSAIGAGVGTLVSGGLGALLGAGGSFITGAISNHFNKKSENRAMEDLAARMELEYQYAQRYAENSPTWTVKGLRQAGINPILPFSNGVPSTPSVSGTGISPSHADTRSESRFDPMLLANLGVADAQREMFLKQGQAALETAAAQTQNARTNSMTAASEVAKRTAEIEKIDWEKQKDKRGGGYQQEWMRDINLLLYPFYESLIETPFNYAKDIFSGSSGNKESTKSFLHHSPKDAIKKGFDTINRLRKLKPNKFKTFEPSPFIN